MQKANFDLILNGKDPNIHVHLLTSASGEVFRIRNAYDAVTNTAAGGMYDIVVQANWIELHLKDPSAGYAVSKVYMEYDSVESLAIFSNAI